MQCYLLAVYELCVKYERVRICDIAKKMGVTKASASAAVKRLQMQGLVLRDQQRLVLLTQRGTQKAAAALGKTAIIEFFLTKVLGVDQVIAAKDACALEHAVGTKTLCTLCRYTNPNH